MCTHTGLGTLSGLEWLSLGYFESVRLSPLPSLSRLRALQLRALRAAPPAAALADALAPLQALRYLALEGMWLDGGGGNSGSEPRGTWDDFVADAAHIVLHGGWVAKSPQNPRRIVCSRAP